jgi:Caspase domain/NACHT domain
LLVATDTYEDATFRRLIAPGSDAVALAAVLADKAIGNYEVLPALRNAPMHQASLAIENILADAHRDDQILLYFSGHGVKNDEGELYLPSANSRHNRLASTAVSALWIRQRMEASRSRRIMVWLDCCYAGAFPPGAMHRAGEDVDASAQLGGLGCVVMTSSTSLEYAFETADNGSATVTGEASPSVFTGVLIDGLRTGDADLDGDGLIDADELYEYVYARMRETPFRQTPTQQSRVEGKLYVASSVRGPMRGEDREPYLDVVSYLAESVLAGGPAQGGRERALLLRLTEHGNPQVAEAARRALDAAAQTMATLSVSPDTAPSRASDNAVRLPAAATVRSASRAIMRKPPVSLLRRLVRAAEPSGACGDKHLDLIAARLAESVREQWTAETSIRWGDRSEPLAVRWSTTGRPVAAPPAAVLGKVIPGRPLRMRLRGDFHEIAEKFRQLPMRQLVILGSPGSGKTALATRMLLGLLTEVWPEDPVPVLLPVSSWNPYQEPAYEWMARRLAEAYPALADRTASGDQAARRLLTAHRVIPVLDGLDEMPVSWQHAALEALDRAVTDQGPLVLTCRSAEYEAAVAARGSFLSYAAVVELETPTAVDIIGYFQANHSPEDQRWKQICDQLRLHPDGPLAQALSTPLMADLAAATYADQATDPAELTDTSRFGGHVAIEQHLLDAFITTRLNRPPPRAYATARAQQWLGFLARHLDRLGVRELEWWKLSQAVPRWVITALVAAVPIMLLVAPLSIVVTTSTANSTALLVAVWGIGVAVATVLGRRAGPAAHSPREQQPPRDILRSVLRGVCTDLGAVINVVSITLAGLLAITYVVSRPIAIGFSFGVVSWTRQLPQSSYFLIYLAMPADAALAIILIPNMLAASYGGMPRRGVPRIGRLFSSLGIGVLTGLMVTSPATIVGILVDRAWLAAGLIVALLLGVVVGLGRWLATPVDEQAAGSPLSVLRGDRLTVLISAAATMAAVFLTSVAAIVVISLMVAGVSVSSWGLAIISCLIASLATAIVVVLGSGSAWLSYSVARWWLALRGQLPWRLTPFLRDAHNRGVLRQVGPAYQFGHALLQDRLAHGQSSARIGRALEITPDSRPEPCARRSSNLWHRLLLLPVIPLAALACGITFVYVGTPRPLRVIDVGDVQVMALSPDDNELATAGSETDDAEIRNLNTGRVVSADYLSSPPQGRVSYIDALAFSADGRTLIAAISDGTIVRWNATSGRKITTSKLSEQTYSSYGFDTDGQLLAVGPPNFDEDSNEHYSVQLLTLARPASKPRIIAIIPFLAPNTEFPYFSASVSSSARPQTIAVSADNDIWIWQSGTSRPVRLSFHSIPHGNVESLALNPEGTVLAAADDSGFVHAWNVRSGRPIEDLVPPVDRFYLIAFSPDGRTVATSNGIDVEIWAAAVG